MSMSLCSMVLLLMLRLTDLLTMQPVGDEHTVADCAPIS